MAFFKRIPNSPIDESSEPENSFQSSPFPASTGVSVNFLSDLFISSMEILILLPILVFSRIEGSSASLIFDFGSNPVIPGSIVIKYPKLSFFYLKPDRLSLNNYKYPPSKGLHFGSHLLLAILKIVL